MTRNIGTDAEIDKERFRTQGSHPSAPSSGHVLLYHITGVAYPGMFIQDANGNKFGPLITGTSASGAGALVLLEQHTASASATLEFTTRNVAGQAGNTIQTDYDDYLLEIVDLIVGTDNVELRMQYSSDSGSSWETSSNYYTAAFYIQNGTSTNTFGANPTTYFMLGSGIENSVSRPFIAKLQLTSFLSTSLSKPIMGNFAFTNQSFVVGGFIQALLLVPATAFNAFKIYASSGNIASGTIRIYGIAKS